MLAVAAGPLRHGLPQVVQLHPALMLTGPDVPQPLAEFGVPEQWRQIVEGHGHRDVVDRGVGDGPDRAVDARVAAEDPEVAGACEVDRLVQTDRRAGIAGVAPAAGYAHVERVPGPDRAPEGLGSAPRGVPESRLPETRRTRDEESR